MVPPFNGDSVQCTHHRLHEETGKMHICILQESLYEIASHTVGCEKVEAIHSLTYDGSKHVIVCEAYCESAVFCSNAIIQTPEDITIYTVDHYIRFFLDTSQS